MMNMHWDALDFDVPVVKGYGWYRIIDTAQPSPNDIVDEATRRPWTAARAVSRAAASSCSSRSSQF